MLSRKEKALKLFSQNYNCAQAILTAYSDLFQINKELALKLAYGFGGGIGGTGKTCGAISAGVMVLSLKYSSIDKDDKVAKINTNTVIRNFINEFLQNHQSINCIDLLTKEEPNKYTMHSLKCERIVAEVCDLLEKYL